MKLAYIATLFLVALAFSDSVSSAKSEYPIKHVVVLMMENRSFDHLLGWLKSINKDIDGLDGTEFNLVNATDPESEKVYVNMNGYDRGPDDPLHDIDSTTEQIFGYHKPYGQKGTPLMNGFVQNAAENYHNITNPMAMFTPANGSAAIINLLAQEFAVFNNWHCSVPGPTDPNRAYVMSATSVGTTTNFNGTLWPQQSYFDFLTQRNVTWRGYYQDDPWALFYFNDTNQPQNSKNMFELDQFYTDLQEGTLGAFSFLQPRMTTSIHGLPTWQHPDASIREGERLIKEIYEAMRSSKYWYEMAFVLTYDEHGGFFDHVAPPQDGVPNPDGITAADGFNFDRLGIRIPTVVISPWVEEGTVVGPPTNGPTNTSQWESTSIMSTANKLFGITDHLTARDAWAATFESLFTTRSVPRLDCPKTLPDIPRWTPQEAAAQRALPLNDHMQIQVAFYCKFNGHDENCGKHIVNQGQASDFIIKEAAQYVASLRQ